MMIKNLIVLATFIAIPFISSAQAYNIRVQIPGFANKDVILGHYFSDRMLPDDTVTLDSKGVGHLTGKEKLPGGMYFLFLPNRKYFDLFINENQYFDIENDTTDFVANFKTKKSHENRLFYDYQMIMIDKSKQAEKLKAEKKTAAGNKEKVKEIDKKLNQLQNEANSELNKAISENPSTFFAAFLKATKEVEMPKDIPDENKFNWYINHYFDNMPLEDDRLVRTPIFENKVNNYLKVLDQLPPDSVEKYVNILFDRSGVNREKGNRNEELFRFMLITVHNHYAGTQIMGLDEVFVYIAENYYIPKAYWADAEYIKKLKENISKTKSNLIGNSAPSLIMQKLPVDTNSLTLLKKRVAEIKKLGYDAHIKIINQYSQDEQLKKDLAEPNLAESKKERILRKSMEKEDKNAVEQKIYDLAYREYVKYFESFYNEVDKYIDDYPDLSGIKTDYTVVWFWEPDCSHCRHETPLMLDFYNRFNQLDFATNDKNMEVYSVYLPRAIDEWGKFTHSLDAWIGFIEEHKMEQWLNVWDPYGETNYRKNYNVYSTPTVYLLDSEKKIVAKRIGVDAIRRILFDKYIVEKRDSLEEKDLLKAVDKVIAIFSSKEELEDLKTVVEGRLEGDAKDKAVKKIEKNMPVEEVEK